MESRSCCFTGHRNLSGQECAFVRDRLVDVVGSLVAKGITEFYCGGALGFDTLAAEVVLEQKKIHPSVHLHMVLPCPDQDKNWSADDRLRFREILERADSCEIVSDRYTSNCMMKRNRRMVDLALYCVDCQRRDHGGTAYTVEYARKKGRQLIHV